MFATTLKPYLFITLLSFGLFGVGYFAGRYYTPPKTVEIIKTVEVKSTEQDNQVNTSTETTVTEKPDGTKITETKQLDTSHITTNTQSNTSTNSVTLFKNDDWFVSVQAKSSLDNLTPVYGGAAYRRIIGSIYIGAFGYTDKSFGAGVGISF